MVETGFLGSAGTLKMVAQHGKCTNNEMRKSFTSGRPACPGSMDGAVVDGVEKFTDFRIRYSDFHY